MKENLLKIADYIEALEQRLAAVEAKLAETEAKLAETEARFAEMGEHVAELEARPVIEQSEIEMDWIEDPEEPEGAEVEEVENVEISAAEEVPAEKETPSAPEKPAEPEIFEEPEKPEVAEPVVQRPAPAPVADLKHAISLGDRFLFQRELFGQNGELMQKTLEALNGMPNLDGALAYLDKHFNWDKESSTFALFLNALHRRFG